MEKTSTSIYKKFEQISGMTTFTCLIILVILALVGGVPCLLDVLNIYPTYFGEYFLELMCPVFVVLGIVALICAILCFIFSFTTPRRKEK